MSNGIKKYMALIESVMSGKYSYVGSCIDSFDEDGEYLHRKLDNITELADIDEIEVQDAIDDYENPSKNFISNIDDYLEGYIPKLESDSVLVYVDRRDIFVLFNPQEDVHYIYE